MQFTRIKLFGVQFHPIVSLSFSSHDYCNLFVRKGELNAIHTQPKMYGIVVQSATSLFGDVPLSNDMLNQTKFQF